ncbi:helix-turn-helix transcriptional regulator [Alkalihalobacillus sp. 1P02AB]|uniref:helix-turn-helix transcriptional regulator n=1 Tax=Alkalihalobacillus sp. 1P02AB TaxID=3132260 RepID=UPI0039A56450
MDGRTTTWLATQTKIKRTTLNNYKNEDIMPPIDKAYKIAKALNKSVYEIWVPKD